MAKGKYYCVLHANSHNSRCEFCTQDEAIARIKNIQQTTQETVAQAFTQEFPPEKITEGYKADSDKPRFSLVPLAALGEVIKVLEFGAKKYAPDNWQKVPDARTRYYDAAMRHLTAWFSGERNDPESGIHHLAHAGCCVLFLLWFEVKS